MINKKHSFIKYTLLTAVTFLVIIVLIEFLYMLGTKDSMDVVIDYMNTKNYVIKKVVGALVYGVIMAYFLKKKGEK
ncbi:MAG: hypothetical protein V3U80_04355 [Flavobacteriaceae bacterium]